MMTKYPKVTLELRQEAYQVGYDHAVRGKKRVPAQDAEFGILLRGFKIGEGVDELLNEWLAGFDQYTNEKVAELFPEDKYFQTQAERKVHWAE
jgi:hypothetical protein